MGPAHCYGECYFLSLVPAVSTPLLLGTSSWPFGLFCFNYGEKGLCTHFYKCVYASILCNTALRYSHLELLTKCCHQDMSVGLINGPYLTTGVFSGHSGFLLQLKPCLNIKINTTNCKASWTLDMSPLWNMYVYCAVNGSPDTSAISTYNFTEQAIQLWWLMFKMQFLQ